MAILVDLSQIAISNIMSSPKEFNNGLDKNMIKHMIMNSIRIYNVQFRNEYGPLVICCDDSNSWRKDKFSHYKSNRKKERDKMEVDWSSIYETITEVKEIMKESFPYKLIQSPNAEADDVIAILSKNLEENVMIIGSDKDYKQLHKYPHVKQYSPRTKEFIKVYDANEELHELIIAGDRSDGIPNVKSPANAFVSGIRQTSIRAGDKANWAGGFMNMIFEDQSVKDRYEQNRELIDFSYIPQNIEDDVMMQYNTQVPAPKKNLMEYFTKNNMKNLYASLQDF